ncbi:MAG: mannose-phosphate guanylyltransferase/mannose-6-phosphate isomerase [Rickettsiales bacterium]|jgi:mannose-1-phosphate guanylyltransferase/mannose-6-phosphate isomerase|nr:mannose-phosphate guanylyltransferase/mannose-6-phosphate isomerase [Rickettsiales bacterium]
MPVALLPLIPVLLAGGKGSRLKPLSNDSLPKQFMRLDGTQDSLFVATLKRAHSITGACEIVIVTTQALLSSIREACRESGLGIAFHILVEPEGKNTAAASLLASQYIDARWGKDQAMWIMPTDHHIREHISLGAAVAQGLKPASEGNIVTFGVTPQRKTSQYGYLCTETNAETGAQKVTTFVEKPQGERLDILYDSGRAYWNSGMFVVTASTLSEEAKTYVPALFQALGDAHTKGIAWIEGMVHCFYAESKAYSALDMLPIDKAIMEKSDRLQLIPLNAGWTDIGSWESLWEISQKDVQGNAVLQGALLGESSQCIVASRKPVHIGKGLDHLVVIETEEEILITRKGAA